MSANKVASLNYPFYNQNIYPCIKVYYLGQKSIPINTPHKGWMMVGFCYLPSISRVLIGGRGEDKKFYHSNLPVFSVYHFGSRRKKEGKGCWKTKCFYFLPMRIFFFLSQFLALSSQSIPLVTEPHTDWLLGTFPMSPLYLHSLFIILSSLQIAFSLIVAHLITWTPNLYIHRLLLK